METFTIQNLSFTYPGRKRPALDHVSLEAREGEFLLLCGKSGCGKSTFLRNLKTALQPHGERRGEILFYGMPLDEVEVRDQTQRIGYVMQSPDNQIVTDKVWHELAFAMENLGYDRKTISIRVAEMASFFGIQTWFREDISELSGGQKQILNLASAMVLQPDVLILDEPTSQLDPIAAADFFTAVSKINREIGTTILLTEHRLDDVWTMADRVIVLNEGRLIASGSPAKVGKDLAERNHPMAEALPAPMQAGFFMSEKGWGKELESPMNVREGRQWINTLLEGKPPKKAYIGEESPEPDGRPMKIELKDVWFRYHREEQDVIRDLSLKVYQGEFLTILGGNGTGKSTALSLMSGIRRAYRGKVKIDGKRVEKFENRELFGGLLGVLPQNPQSIFVEETIEKDLYEMFRGRNVPQDEQRSRVEKVVSVTEIGHLMDVHPYDISGGEQQRAALAKILLLEPELLLLDEPTKGMDAYFKQQFAKVLLELKERGITIVMVSHDIEFCGRYADRCAMFFDGAISTLHTPRRFFSGNSFYTTSANRMSRHVFADAVTAEDLAYLLETELVRREGGDLPPEPPAPKGKPNPEKKPNPPSSPTSGTKSALIQGGVILLMVLTLFGAIRFSGDRVYYISSFLIILYMLVPFFASFERRKPAARELILMAVLIAIGVAGRVVFFMILHMTPILAITIIAGCALGSQSGFLVGAMIMFVSNFFFGQGPWTPWQMFALGMVGLLTGLIFSRRAVGRKPILMAIYGILAGYLYGLIVDLWTIFALTPDPSWQAALSIYALAAVINTMRALSTGVILFLLFDPMLKKIVRIQNKYGVLQLTPKRALE